MSETTLATAERADTARPDPIVAERRRANPLILWLLLALLAFTGVVIASAMTRTSTTFDEIVMIAGGVRGYETGEWSIAPEHPPLVQYLYGLPAWLARPSLPTQPSVAPEQAAEATYRYDYARLLFWRAGNDGELLAFLGRLPAVLCALGLVAAVFAFTAGVAGPAAALLAAVLVAMLPDVLAHGGVAYNDVPVALALFAAIWAIERAVRNPGIRAGILAGVFCALALAVKNSAVALLPIGVLLLVAEAISRWRQAAWWRGVGVAAITLLVGGYLTLVVVYRMDFSLSEYRYALSFMFGHVTESNRAPSFLLGQVSGDGWWYYFPVAFLFKTSAALHLLIVIALVAWVPAVRRAPRRILESPLRAPLVAFVCFGGLLLTANLNIGFRYALPALPHLCILVAVGVARFWRTTVPAGRTIVAAACIWLVAHPLSYYPNFLAYISEYGPGRDRGHLVLGDSSLDWGQGLIQLREFMFREGIDRVYLSYFGSALPDGYGIDYVPLASFFPLPVSAISPADGETPEWIAISATNLTGTYVSGPAFAAMRDRPPDHVVAHTIHLYRVQP